LAVDFQGPVRDSSPVEQSAKVSRAPGFCKVMRIARPHSCDLKP
jgi:hypothetical protein